MSDQSDRTKPAIVLVHGAWADASCWNGVIAQLHTAGCAVSAPPNPLRSLALEAATIVTFVKSILGPLILLGHSAAGDPTWSPGDSTLPSGIVFALIALARSRYSHFTGERRI